ncbi:MAG: hypothetical protein K9G26_00175 [Emcibacter sp.]|nr:hypothetical protein [Emcibacter sp.]
MSEQFIKDPNAVIDYVIDWATNYLLDTEQVMTSDWFIFPEGSVNDLAVDHIPPLVSNVATVFVSGGIAGHIYQLTNRIVTNQSRTDERTISIRIEEK